MELVKFPSNGRFSVRSIFSFVLAVILTALFWTALSSTPTHAADATWGGDAIIYDNHSFTQAPSIDDASSTIPADAIVYKTKVQTEGSSSDRKVFIIYFAPGVDPPTATAARYVEFSVRDGKLYSPQNAKDIELSVKSEQSPGSSCSINGIGWILCPVTTYLAEGMDWIFGLLAGMIETQAPILGDSSNSIYIAWNIMRSIANVAFVIAFLIIIYSQLTSMGVSNYGLKKLIPRLIVAAVLVNISFYITALAIDISNILGYSIQDIFNSIREGLFHLTEDELGAPLTGTWSQVTSIILAGGGVYAGAYYLAVGGGAAMLVPLLLGLFATIMLVVIILAARQAIIMILVIIAPLAFVANLLPNTEKWFGKWKDLFFTMLIFFPAFSLVFGGSQLAGQLIIQNAGDNIITVVFGLAVQVAPLVITPLILKLSGGLLGRIAQIANNPRKGMIDRSRNWANDRRTTAQNRNLAKDRKWFNPWRYPAAVQRSGNFANRKAKERGEYWKQMADNRYHGTDTHGKMQEQMQAATLEKETIENKHKAHLAQESTRKGSELNLRTIKLEDAKVSAELASAKQSHMTSGYRAGDYTTDNAELITLRTKMAANVIETAAWKQGEEANKYVAQRKASERMRRDESLLDVAQGYGSDELRGMGRDRAQATAVSVLSRLNEDARKNAITLMKTEAVESKQAIPNYLGDLFKKANSSDPAVRAGVSSTKFEAAMEIAAEEGMVWLFENARRSTVINQDTIDDVVARHVGDMKGKGGFHIQAKPELSLQRYLEAFQSRDTQNPLWKAVSSASSTEDVTALFNQDMDRARLATLSNTTSANLGNVKFGVFAGLASDLVPHEVEDPITREKKMVSLLDSIRYKADGSMVEEDREMVGRIFESLRDGLTDPSTRATMTDRLKFARDMEETLRAQFFPEKEPLTPNDSERAHDTPADPAND